MPPSRKTRSAPRAVLDQAGVFGVVGDIHGDLDLLLPLLDEFARRGVQTIVAAGDVGIFWPGKSPSVMITQLSQRLATNGESFYWVEGNRDSYPILRSFPLDDDGLRRLTPDIIHLPRGYRMRLASGKTLAALGGANSIDREHRSRVTWWPDEAILEVDLERLGNEHADVLVGHDAPNGPLTLEEHLAATDRFWTEKGLDYARRGRAMYTRALMQVQPQLSVSGHYHVGIDEWVGYYDKEHDRGFATRVVVLDRIQGFASAAIVDTDTLAVRFLSSSGDDIPTVEPVKELTYKMHGTWMVHTLRSRHRFDLDHGTVERLPGPLSTPTTSDGVHRIRSLDECRIGAPGLWTMRSFDYLTDFYWHRSSVIKSIERVADESPEGTRP